MERVNFIILLLVILVIIKIYIANKENFTDCSQFGDNYNQCYNSGDCTVMVDLKGSAFCTNKNI